MKTEIKSQYQISPDFIDRALHIAGSDPRRDKDVGYSTRVLTQASLPHRKPKDNTKAWIRTNGKYCLTISPHEYIDPKTGDRINTGIPFGIYPRLILLFICSEVIYQKTKVINFGPSLSNFMHELGLPVMGGKRGSHTRFKDQLVSLMFANISYTYTETKNHVTNLKGSKQPITKHVDLWWSEKSPDQQTLFDSYIILDEDFYQEVKDHSVPLHKGVIREFRESPMGIDIYTWLAHRVVSVVKPQFISWKSFEMQMGSNYSSTKDFKRSAKFFLKKTMALWEGLKIEFPDGGFELHPSRTHVKPKWDKFYA